MVRTMRPALSKSDKHLSEMLDLHLRAYHLPHVRRYHAQRSRRLKSYNKADPKPGQPRRRWTLPLHLADVAQLHLLDSESERHTGWLQFLDWRNGMVAIAEYSKDIVLSCLSTGSSVKAQRDIAARVLTRKKQKQQLRVIAIPVLHFRALAYADKATKKKIIVPLTSAIARLQLGRRYTLASIQSKLKVALEQRLQKAREAAERAEAAKRPG